MFENFNPKKIIQKALIVGAMTSIGTNAMASPSGGLESVPEAKKIEMGISSMKENAKIADFVFGGDISPEQQAQLEDQEVIMFNVVPGSFAHGYDTHKEATQGTMVLETTDDNKEDIQYLGDGTIPWTAYILFSDGTIHHATTLPAKGSTVEYSLDSGQGSVHQHAKPIQIWFAK